jgi:flap endonuclease-1
MWGGGVDRPLGVKLGDLFPSHAVPDGWYDGKRIAVDGHNVAFRYITSFRGRDGDVLRNKDGKAIAHLVGFTNLVRHLRLKGAEPILVWDGATHPRKRATVEERIIRRVEAALNAQEALEKGDRSSYAKFQRQTTYLDGSMIRDATALFESLGVAVVNAPHDGERYGAALCLAGHADAVATEDYDALVAGAPVVLRKAGSAEPWLHHLSDLAAAGLTQDQLRAIAILCGTDWHPGVTGFGAKTAAKLVKGHDLRALLREGGGKHAGTFLAEGFTLELFEELDLYIRTLPEVGAPVAAKPDPGRAAQLAAQLGLEPSRVLGCFC